MAFFLLHIGVTGLAIRYLRIAAFLPVRYMQTLLPPSLVEGDEGSGHLGMYSVHCTSCTSANENPVKMVREVNSKVDKQDRAEVSEKCCDAKKLEDANTKVLGMP